MRLYHGSNHIIEHPAHGAGNPHNDYGLGFYCTQNVELAKEWGTAEDADGFANAYGLDENGLVTCNLNDGSYTILHWLAVLLENRIFRVSGDAAYAARDYLLETFHVDYARADIVRGYRADDSYFSFASSFLNNALTLARLERAVLLGNLGEQVVVRSKRAFERLRFEGAGPAPRSAYYPLKAARDAEARRAWREEVRGGSLEDGVFVMDIVRGKWGADDERLQRIVSG